MPPAAPTMPPPPPPLPTNWCRREGPSPTRPVARPPVALQAPTRQGVRPATEDLADRVDAELREQQNRLQQQEQDRSRRMGGPKGTLQTTSAVPDIAALAAAMTFAAAREGDAGPHVDVDIKLRETLRAAIILHEILSPPKAIRTAPEMWEI